MKYSSLSQDEESTIVRRLREGDQRALADLVTANRGWVIGMAYSYGRAGVSREDLVSEGVVGLLDAARRFDPSYGTRFATYARYWVRANMLQFIAKNRRAVAAPESRVMRRLRLRLNRTERDLESRAGGRVTDDAIAIALGVSQEDVTNARSAFSMRDVPVAHGDPERGEHAPLADDLPDELVIRREEHALVEETVARALSSLSSRELKVVGERILQRPQRTLREIGDDLGISRERVRQIQTRALEKMRVALAGAPPR